MKVKRVINALKGRTGKQLINTAIHMNELKGKKSVLNSLPLTLDVVPTNKCNLKCSIDTEMELSYTNF